jgi:hypothetical protein
MGNTFLSKYQVALEDSISLYLTRANLHKNLLLDEEINELINFLIENSIVREGDFFKLVMLAPGHSKLLAYIGSHEFSSSPVMISLLCLCKLSLESQPVILSLYLKLLLSMVPLFLQHGQS